MNRRLGCSSDSDCSNDLRPSVLSYEQSSERCAMVRPSERPRVPDDLLCLTPALMNNIVDSFINVMLSRLPEPVPWIAGKRNSLGRFLIIVTSSLRALSR